MKAGDIVVVPFPFSDLTSLKIRPALIVSSNAFNESRNLLLVAISTKKGLEEFSIPLSQKNLNSGELKKESFIRLQNIFTLEKRMIIKKVGKMNEKSYANFKKKFEKIIG